MGTSTLKRLLSVCALAGLIGVIAATAATTALAQTASVYCVNGGSTTLPTTLTFSGGSRSLTEGTAEAIISNSFDSSTFYLGFTSGGGGHSSSSPTTRHSIQRPFLLRATAPTR